MMGYLDLGHHFYKTATNILGDPQNFYNVLNLDENNGRISMFGISAGVIVTGDMIAYIEDEMGDDKARSIGRVMGSSIVKHVMDEYGFELSTTSTKKLIPMYLDMIRDFGMGEFHLKRLSLKHGSFAVQGKRVLTGRKKDYAFIRGVLEGIYREVVGTPVKVSLLNERKGVITFGTE